MVKYFISHSSKNKEIAKEFIDLLILGGAVTHQDIFCSSSYGYGIKPGNNFVNKIKKNLDTSTIVFSLISPNYLDSPFCWAELEQHGTTIKDCHTDTFSQSYLFRSDCLFIKTLKLLELIKKKIWTP